jgi:hypothetical protein
MRRFANPAQVTFDWGFASRLPFCEPRTELGIAATPATPPTLGAAATLAAPATRAKKKKREKLAPSPVALECAVLGIDPGELSGFSIWQRGRLVEFGEVDVFSTAPTAVLERFVALEGPHVLVVERPFRVKYQNQTGIGTADKMWRELAKRLRVPRWRTVRVYPPTWRARQLPKGFASAKREKVRLEERFVAELVVLDQLGAQQLPDLGDESAPAVLIGRWGVYAGEVQKVLPKGRGRKKARV